MEQFWSKIFENCAEQGLTRIKDQNVVLTISMKFVNKCSQCRFSIAYRIESEVFVSIHIVNVIPYCLQRDVCLSIVLNDISQVINVLISPLALMKPYTGTFPHPINSKT